MWWKALSVVLLVYTLLAGMLVPLKSGIVRTEPAFVRTGQDTTLRFFGYNTFFGKPSDEPVRVWLYYNERYALAARSYRAVNDTVLEASFRMPQTCPKANK
ncbi:MAG: hypothetical protein IPM98_05715 [Lewinellaceae bacterium]|nr:hypothetical protein [Lewinellaceae bacterium]